MSGGTKQSQQSTSSNTINPQSMAMLQGNYATAQGNAATVGQQYNGQLTAGFTPTQTQAQGILSNIATDPSYGSIANSATSGAQGVLNSNPLSAQDLQQYENPYQSSVIDASVAQNERAREIAQNQDNMQATAGNAFGGSRSGVANALTNEAYDRNDQTNLASLISANYTQAQQASLAAKNLTLNAASGVAGLNNNALGVATQQGGILSAVGDAQQQQQQTQLTNAYQAFLTGKQLTIDQQNLLNSALGLIPTQQTINSSGTSQTSTNPGLAGILGGLAGAGETAGGLGWAPFA